MSQTPSNDEPQEEQPSPLDDESGELDLGDELNLDDLEDSSSPEAEALDETVLDEEDAGPAEEVVESAPAAAEAEAPEEEEAEAEGQERVAPIERPHGVYSLMLVVSAILVAIALTLNILELRQYSSSARKPGAAPAQAPRPASKKPAPKKPTPKKPAAKKPEKAKADSKSKPASKKPASEKK